MSTKRNLTSNSDDEAEKAILLPVKKQKTKATNDTAIDDSTVTDITIGDNNDTIDGANAENDPKDNATPESIPPTPTQADSKSITTDDSTTTTTTTNQSRRKGPGRPSKLDKIQNDKDKKNNKIVAADVTNMRLADLYDTFNPLSRASRSRAAAVTSIGSSSDDDSDDSDDDDEGVERKRKRGPRLSKTQRRKLNSRFQLDEKLLPSAMNTDGLDSGEDVPDSTLPDCCLEHTCVNTVLSHQAFAQDIQHRFLLESQLTSDFTKRYLTMEPYGTISNDIIKVCVTDIAATPMLGIFAARDIAQEYPVTAYGGIQRLEHALGDEPKAHLTHSRSIPGTGSCFDGKPLADLIKHNQNATCEMMYGAFKKPWLYQDMVGLLKTQQQQQQQQQDGKDSNSNNKSQDPKSKNLTTTTSSDVVDAYAEQGIIVVPPTKAQLFNQTPLITINPDLVYDTTSFSLTHLKHATTKAQKDLLEWTDDFDNFTNIYHCSCSRASGDRCRLGQCQCVYKRMLLEYSLETAIKAYTAQLKALATTNNDAPLNTTSALNNPLPKDILERLFRNARTIKQMPVCFWHEFHLPIDERTALQPFFVTEPVLLAFPRVITPEIEKYVVEKLGDKKCAYNVVPKDDKKSSKKRGKASGKKNAKENENDDEQDAPVVVNDEDNNDIPTPPQSFYTVFNKLHDGGMLAVQFNPPFQSLQSSNNNNNSNSSSFNGSNKNNQIDSNDIIFYNKTPSVAFNGIILEPLDFQIRVRTLGAGYMSNTADKSRYNIKIDPVDVVRNRTLAPILILRATRPIEKNEEIISPYNNVDDRYVKLQKSRKRSGKDKDD